MTYLADPQGLPFLTCIIRSHSSTISNFLHSQSLSSNRYISPIYKHYRAPRMRPPTNTNRSRFHQPHSLALAYPCPYSAVHIHVGGALQFHRACAYLRLELRPQCASLFSAMGGFVYTFRKEDSKIIGARLTLFGSARRVVSRYSPRSAGG